MVLAALVAATREWFMSFGAVGLFTLAFVESSFFPIPPDVVLIPLALATPELAILYATVTTLGSVFGAWFGYYLGEKGGRPALERVASDKNIDRVEQYYDEYGVLAVGVAGFSPVPYKVFTISSGAFNLDLKRFLAVSFISRGARFYLEALLLMFYGREIVAFIEGPFGILTVIIGAAIVAGYVVWKKYL